MKRRSDIRWGIIFIGLAVLIIVGQLGLIEGIGFWTLFLSAIFISSLVDGAIKRDVSQILFSVAFLCIVWDDVLGITNLTPWPVLFAALFASIGCNKLFKKDNGIYEKKTIEFFSDESKTEINMDSDENVRCGVSFSSVVKYINSDNLQTVYISSDFGSASVYFDNAKVPSGEVVVKVNADFSNVELFVPRDWNVVNNLDTAFSGVDIVGTKTGVNAVNMILVGSVDFGGVKVRYV